MEFVILGPTALTVKGRDVPLGVAKQRGLLAVLLYHVGSPVRIETIVEHLWADRPVDDCRPSLYALASRTRAALRGAGLKNALVRVPSTGAYRLDIDPNLVDYRRFRNLVVQARQAAARDQQDLCAALLEQAIGLWRDEPLADLRTPRSEHIRRPMKDALLTAHKLLAESQLLLGRQEEVIAWLEPLMPVHDVDEVLARHWISALTAAGRPDDAREFTTSFRKRFRQHMHTAPTLDLTPVRASAHPAHPSGEARTGADRAQPPRQLPNDIQDFCGHDELLAELDRLTAAQTSGGSTVVLAGMPGAGKTTLAIHWAHRRRDRFPDGQLYLNADGHGPTPPVRPEEALRRLLLALGVPAEHMPPTESQRRERFAQELRDRRVLVVVDNVMSAEQVRPLIAASSGSVTVITSRNRLRSLTIREGVRSIVVAPLSDDEALGLLRRVIGPTRADLEPVALQALARLSGGLPLALRIIAEHVAERPRARIADQVEELATHLLDDAGEDGDDSTLGTVFAWSYDTLDPPSARLFRLLGLHPGRTISSAAAAALLGAGTQYTERVLNVLARAHLVHHDTARRYGQHELLRLYAADRASREETAAGQHAAIGRLLDWYLLSAVDAARMLAPHRPPVPDLPDADGIEPLTFTSAAAAMSWCETERANLNAVVRLAAERGFARRAWQIPGAIHDMFGRYGRQDDVVDNHEIALAASIVDGHEVGQLGTYNNLGASYFAIHDYRRATELFTAGLAIARRIGDVAAEATCSHNLASAHLKAGDAASAIPIFRNVLRMWTDTANLAGQASTLSRLGDALGRLGRHDEAAGHYREALAIWEQIGSLRGQATTYGRLAALSLETGQPADALAHGEWALRMHDQARDESTRCDTLTTMADAQRRLGRYRESEQTANLAIAASHAIADPHRRALALAVLADTRAATGDHRGARENCSAGLELIGDDAADPELHAIRTRLLATDANAAHLYAIGTPDRAVASPPRDAK